MKVWERMRRDPITVAETDDLATALQLMLWNGVRHLPVLRGKRLIGVLSQRDILARHDPVFPQSMLDGKVVDAMVTDVAVTYPKEELHDAAARMSTNKYGCLPVVDAGRVVGILTTTDMLTELAWCEVPGRIFDSPTVDELMTTDPVVAHPDDLLLDAADRMVQRGIRHLPVVDGDRKVVGILSDRDVRSAIGNPLQWVGDEPGDDELSGARVKEHMTVDPRVIERSAPLERVLSILVDEHVGAIPVVDGDHALAGIISYVDVLRVARIGAQRATR